MSPLGSPKVAYRAPGSSTAEWVDLYNRMYRERILFIGQEIDDNFANQMIGVLLYLDNEDSSQPITIYINSPGGSMTAGMALYDTMCLLKSEVTTLNVGLAGSVASLLLAAGTPSKRFALPHSRVMLHQPVAGVQGQAEDIKTVALQVLKTRETLLQLYSQLTGQSKQQIAKDIDRDFFMSAEQAKTYGLVDHVMKARKT